MGYAERQNIKRMGVNNLDTKKQNLFCTAWNVPKIVPKCDVVIQLSTQSPDCADKQARLSIRCFLLKRTLLAWNVVANGLCANKANKN